MAGFLFRSHRDPACHTVCLADGVSRANPKKLETGLGTISAAIPYTLLLRIEAIGFPTFWASTVIQTFDNPGFARPTRPLVLVQPPLARGASSFQPLPSVQDWKAECPLKGRHSDGRSCKSLPRLVDLQHQLLWLLAGADLEFHRASTIRKLFRRERMHWFLPWVCRICRMQNWHRLWRCHWQTPGGPSGRY